MAVSFEVGTKVKVLLDDVPYAGTIITYNENIDPVLYRVSIEGIGTVLDLEESNIVALS